MSLAELSEQELDRIQREAFGYFIREGDDSLGLIFDSTQPGSPCSIAGCGLALSSFIVGVERKLIDRQAAACHAVATLRSFMQSAQSEKSDATGYRGFYYHFIEVPSAKRAWRSELSTIDSAILIAGALSAAEYFNHDSEIENEIRSLADAMYRRVEWDWMWRDSAISHGWKPRSGFLRYGWRGYNEGLLLYILALGSPTHPVPVEAYDAWLSEYRWRQAYGIDYLYAGPLFIHQLPQCWLDLRGVQDAYMREKGIDYFENSRRATLVQQAYAKENPHQFRAYGEHCWGFTASDGPGKSTMIIDGRERRFYGYRARGAPDGPDDGSISPWAVVASMPFCPEIVQPTVRNFWTRHIGEQSRYGFEATFNPTCRVHDQVEHGWVSPNNFALNQGPVVVMVENHRTGLLWSWMRNNPYVRQGLRRAGFTGGWLE